MPMTSLSRPALPAAMQAWLDAGIKDVGLAVVRDEVPWVIWIPVTPCRSAGAAARPWSGCSARRADPGSGGSGHARCVASHLMTLCVLSRSTVLSIGSASTVWPFAVIVVALNIEL
jgi:hypothetical protein